MSTTYRTRTALPFNLPADVLAILETLRATWLALNAEPAGIQRLAYDGPETAYRHVVQAFIRTLATVPGVRIEDAERVKEEIDDNGENAEYNWNLLVSGLILPDGEPFIETEIAQNVQALGHAVEDGEDDYADGLRQYLGDLRDIEARLVAAAAKAA